MRCGWVALAVVVSCDGEIRLAGNPVAPAAASPDSGIPAPSPEGGPGGGGGAGECSVTATCRFGRCDVGARVCVECLADPDCTTEGRPRCDVASHRCVACGLSVDCAGGGTCEPTTHRCVPTCGACPSDSPICDTGREICVACRGPADCSSDRTCDVTGGRCVACLSDAQCGARDRPRCDPVSGLCVACITSGDCPTSAPTCDPTKLECQGG